MAETLIDELRARRAALESRLNAPTAAGELDALKAEIGGLFKIVEGELAAFTVLRGDVMQLVDAWKTVKAIAKPSSPSTAVASSFSMPVQETATVGRGVSAATTAGTAVTPSLAPQFITERRVVHADHIGASTFIEKGWSKISAGDYPGAGGGAAQGPRAVAE